MTHNSSSKGKSRLILMAFVVLAMMSVACGGGGDSNDVAVEPTAEVITGDVTADAIIEDTQEAVSTTVSALCSLCRFNESGEDGDLCNCNSVCNTDVVCQETAEGE